MLSFLFSIMLGLKMKSRGNEDFIRQLKAVAPDKSAVKSLSDAVGNPDNWDKENLTRLINNFKRRKFSVEGFIISGATLIKMCRDEARASHNVELGENKFNVKIKDSDMRAVTAIPQALYQELEETMPTLFREKKHFEWFIKNFKEFMIADRY